MLPYLLVMVILINNSSSTIIQQLPDQQTCKAIEQDIEQQSAKVGVIIVSENCYSIPGGGSH